jgi:hypothetical protein
MINQDEMEQTLDRIPIAKELIGAYGECRGALCPHCGGLNRVIGNPAHVMKCFLCGNLYSLPQGYYYSGR